MKIIYWHRGVSPRIKDCSVFHSVDSRYKVTQLLCWVFYLFIVCMFLFSFSATILTATMCRLILMEGVYGVGVERLIVKLAF